MSAPKFTHRILECKYCDEPYCFHCASPNVFDAENFCSAVCEEADSREPVSESPEWVAR
jgi:hypothetical protein